MVSFIIAAVVWFFAGSVAAVLLYFAVARISYWVTQSVGVALFIGWLFGIAAEATTLIFVVINIVWALQVAF